MEQKVIKFRAWGGKHLMESQRFDLNFPFPAVCVREGDINAGTDGGKMTLERGRLYNVCGIAWHDFKRSYTIRLSEVGDGNFGFLPDRFVPELTVRYNLIARTGKANIADLTEDVISGASRRRY